jgi:hypothetical protein
MSVMTLWFVEKNERLLIRDSVKHLRNKTATITTRFKKFKKTQSKTTSNDEPVAWNELLSHSLKG